MDILRGRPIAAIGCSTDFPEPPAPLIRLPHDPEGKVVTELRQARDVCDWIEFFPPGYRFETAGMVPRELQRAIFESAGSYRGTGHTFTSERPRLKLIKNFNEHPRHRLQRPAPRLPRPLRQRLDRDAEHRPARRRGGGLRPPLRRKPDHHPHPPSWWTGRYGFPDADQGWTPLRADEPILPDLLWNRGFPTALVSDNAFLREAGQGFGRGFDDVVWVRGSGYDKWIPADDPRVKNVRLRTSPVLRARRGRPEPRGVGRALEQYLRNREVLGWRRTSRKPARPGPSRRRWNGSTRPERPNPVRPLARPVQPSRPLGPPSAVSRYVRGRGAR